MANIVVVLVIIGIVSLSVKKIISEKRKGVKCVGCPLSGASGKKCSCS